MAELSDDKHACRTARERADESMSELSARVGSLQRELREIIGGVQCSGGGDERRALSEKVCRSSRKDGISEQLTISVLKDEVEIAKNEYKTLKSEFSKHDSRISKSEKSINKLESNVTQLSREQSKLSLSHTNLSD
eukprot:530625_1